MKDTYNNIIVISYCFVHLNPVFIIVSIYVGTKSSLYFSFLIHIIKKQWFNCLLMSNVC